MTKQLFSVSKTVLCFGESTHSDWLCASTHSSCCRSTNSRLASKPICIECGCGEAGQWPQALQSAIMRCSTWLIACAAILLHARSTAEQPALAHLRSVGTAGPANWTQRRQSRRGGELGGEWVDHREPSSKNGGQRGKLHVILKEGL